MVVEWLTCLSICQVWYIEWSRLSVTVVMSHYAFVMYYVSTSLSNRDKSPCQNSRYLSKETPQVVRFFAPKIWCFLMFLCSFFGSLASNFFHYLHHFSHRISEFCGFFFVLFTIFEEFLFAIFNVLFNFFLSFSKFEAIFSTFLLLCLFWSSFFDFGGCFSLVFLFSCPYSFSFHFWKFVFPPNFFFHFHPPIFF